MGGMWSEANMKRPQPRHACDTYVGPGSGERPLPSSLLAGPERAGLKMVGEVPQDAAERDGALQVKDARVQRKAGVARHGSAAEPPLDSPQEQRPAGNQGSVEVGPQPQVPTPCLTPHRTLRRDPEHPLLDS